MALYESTGEVRQPQEGELFLTGFPQLIFTRHVMIASALPVSGPRVIICRHGHRLTEENTSALPVSGPRVIMRKVEESSHV
jgi:hypothetical protein